MSNVAIKVSADVSSLQAQFAIAKAQSQALTSELNKLARQAAQSGDNMSAEMKAGLLQASEAAVQARANVASLHTQMARTEPSIFGERLSGLRHIMQGLADPIRGVYSGVGKIGEAFAAAAAAYGAVRFFSDVTKGAAELQHQSDVLQLSVTAYQALQQAAIDSGTGIDVAEQALERFSRSVSQAQTGTGLAAKDLVEMGISASQSKEAILQQVATFALHSDAMTRDRIATDFFGRSGTEIIPVLQQWAQGTDALTQKYQALGRILGPETTKAAEDADIAMSAAWAHLKTEAAPAIVTTTSLLADLVEWGIKANDTFLNFATFGLFTGGSAAAPVKPNVPVAHAPTEQDEVAALNSIDMKMRERIDLEKELAIAKKTAADASKAGDTKGLVQANEAVADLQKQLDSLNKPEAVGGFANAGDQAISAAKTQIASIQENANPAEGAAATSAAIEQVWRQLLDDHRLNAKQHAEVEQELDRQIAAGKRAAGQEADQEARSDAQTQVALATQAFNEKKSLLDEEFTAHQITAREKYQATVQALMEEVAAQKAAQQQIIDSDVTTVVQRHEAANQIVVLDAQMNAQIAAAARQLTTDLKEEDQGRAQSWRAVTSEIESTENQFISSIFSGRQTLTQSIAQAGANLLQADIQQGLKYLTEHQMVNMGILASDKATTDAGVILRMVGIGKVTAAEQAGAATQLATKEAAKDAGSAADVASGSAQIMNDASKAAAGAYSAVVGIPVVGPIIAPVAAATAFGAVAAFDTLTSFDVGTNVVPRDMIAQIHEGEAIVPKKYNPAAGGDGGGGGGDHHWTYNNNVTGTFGNDDLARMLDRGQREFQQFIKRQVRNGSLKLER